MARGPREGQKTEDKQCGQGSQGKVRACKQGEVESDRVRERGERAGQRGTRIPELDGVVWSLEKRLWYREDRPSSQVWKARKGL